jgi:hypothetical protein
MSGATMTERLEQRIRSFLLDDEVALSPDDPAGEVRRNTWTHGVGGGSLSTRDELLAALQDVALGLRARFAATEQRGRFYAWYDDQAGLLRCSLTSQPTLPFAGSIRTTSHPGDVVDRLQEDPTPGFIGFNGLGDVDAGASDADVEGAPELIVWVAAV